MISTGWYKDMVGAFVDRFEVKETSDYGATDALLNKSYGFTLGDMERLFDNPTAHWPLQSHAQNVKIAPTLGILIGTRSSARLAMPKWSATTGLLKGFEK